MRFTYHAFREVAAARSPCPWRGSGSLRPRCRDPRHRHHRLAAAKTRICAINQPRPDAIKLTWSIATLRSIAQPLLAAEIAETALRRSLIRRKLIKMDRS